MKNFPIEKDCVLLLTDRRTRKYASDVDVAEGFLLVGNNATAFVDARYFYAAQKTFASVGIDCKLYKGLDDLSDFIKNLNVKKLLVDYRKTTVREYEDYKAFGLPIEDGATVIENAMSVKSDCEIEKIKKACSIVQKAYYSVIKELKVGITEIEVRDKIEKSMMDFGADGIAFETIVAFGENSAVPHHVTGQKQLSPDTVILIDTGCTVDGYCSDLTRTTFFGNPTKKFMDCYNSVLMANAVAEQNITDGISCKDADAFAREYLKQKGLDKYFTHSLGHGVGLEIHEAPTLSPKSKAVLKNNMVFTVEPGVYFDGEFGIRIEDTVILKDGKVIRLFDDDKKLLIL